METGCFDVMASKSRVYSRDLRLLDVKKTWGTPLRSIAVMLLLVFRQSQSTVIAVLSIYSVSSNSINPLTKQMNLHLCIGRHVLLKSPWHTYPRVQHFCNRTVHHPSSRCNVGKHQKVGQIRDTAMNGRGCLSFNNKK